jgi:hypothetical protein
MAEAIACRGCHRPLIDEAGCALCLPVKPHLIPLEVTDEDAVPLAQLATETATLLRSQLKQLKAWQKVSPEYNMAVANESRAHAAALAKLLDSARKVIQDGADAVDSMTFQEKAALFKEWFRTLPPAYRRQLHDEMTTDLMGREPPQLEMVDVGTN